MMKTGRTLLTVSLVLLSTTARGQERRKFTPVRATNEPVAASPRFDGGMVPVEVRGSFEFHELNDEFEPDRVPQISAVDAIEKLLDTRSPAPTTKWTGFSPTSPSGSPSGLIDPQIAASNSIVGVLLWNRLGWYDKSGTLLPSTPTFPNPTSTEALFKPLIDWLDSTANLNPSVAGDSSFLFANGQVGDARRRPASPQVVRRADHAQAVGAQRSGDELGAVTDGAGADADVEAFVHEIHDAVGEREFEFQATMHAPQLEQQRRDEAPAEDDGHRHAHAPTRLAQGLVERGAGSLHFAAHAQRMLEIEAAQVGERAASRAAMEQQGAQALFEPRNRLAHPRARLAQPQRGGGEAALFRGGDEDVEQAEQVLVHGGVRVWRL